MKKTINKIVILLFLPLLIFNSSYSATGKVKVKETHQTMHGFGAAIAWAENTVTQNRKKAELYDHMFVDLGLDILRLKNNYRNGQINSSASIIEIVNKMFELSPVKPIIYISSWTPPSNLKSNNAENGDGTSNSTLKKYTGTTQYMYKEFGDYWANSLIAYRNIGIEPDYISIQNEPSFDATWESCRFEPAETSTIAGYNKALDSVYAAFQRNDLHPKIMAAEVHGIGYNTFQNYAARFDKNKVDAYNYHLYHGDNGGENTNPDAFNTNLKAVANAFKDKPIWQSEFDRGDWFQNAWLIHNCLVNGNVNAYLWWQLAWGQGGKPLFQVAFENYARTNYYWMFRQYAKWVDSGWIRVTTESDDTALKISGFVNPGNTKLTLIVLNTSAATSKEMNFEIQDFIAKSGIVVRTNIDANEKGFEVSGNYIADTAMVFPAHSITTIALSSETGTAVENNNDNPEQYSLSRNYPNPFNPSTRINYSLAAESFVQLKVYDILGREISTLVQSKMSAGNHNVEFNAEGLESGVYIYTIKAQPVDGQNEDFTQSSKMILLK